MSSVSPTIRKRNDKEETPSHDSRAADSANFHFISKLEIVLKLILMTRAWLQNQLELMRDELVQLWILLTIIFST
jgi:hypothetical protein